METIIQFCLAHIFFQMVVGSTQPPTTVIIQPCRGTGMIWWKIHPLFEGFKYADRVNAVRVAFVAPGEWDQGPVGPRSRERDTLITKTTQKVPTEMDLYGFGMKILKMWMLIVYVLIIMHSCIVMEGGVKSYIHTSSMIVSSLRFIDGGKMHVHMIYMRTFCGMSIQWILVCICLICHSWWQ